MRINRRTTPHHTTQSNHSIGKDKIEIKKYRNFNAHAAAFRILAKSAWQKRKKSIACLYYSLALSRRSVRTLYKNMTILCSFLADD